MSGLRRAALVFGILALLLFADGAYLLATHNSVGGDTGILFGNAHDHLNAGTVVVLSGVLVLAASVIMWLVDIHRQDKERERRLADRTASHAPAGDPPTHEQPGPSGRTASHA
jgi:hypothetical protein